MVNEKSVSEFADCHRCGGSGRLPQFSSVIGGTCFLCHGSGKSKAKPGKKRSTRYVVSAVCLKTGVRLRPCVISAASPEKALRIARTQIASGNGYDPESVEVVAE